MQKQSIAAQYPVKDPAINFQVHKLEDKAYNYVDASDSTSQESC